MEIRLRNMRKTSRGVKTLTAGGVPATIVREGHSEDMTLESKPGSTEEASFQQREQKM